MLELLAAAVLAAAQPAAPLQTFQAAEARQGVAVDRRHFYAIDNSAIGKYDRRTGARVGGWRGDPSRFPHLNACVRIARELVCAASNYPATPHASAVEIFDAARMVHRRTIPMAEAPGSLTWVARHDGAWWAAFANYDGRGGEPGRDHRYTTLVRFDDGWRRTASWRFPASVLARFAPASTSGGVFGHDGRLYVTGHDHAEVYVLAPAPGGAVLEHLATLPAPIEGQAIAADPLAPDVLWGIRRKSREVVSFRIVP